MLQTSKQADEWCQAHRTAASSDEPSGCTFWLLHGAVGSASDWRSSARKLAENGITSKSIDLWRFLDERSKPLPELAVEINQEAAAEKTSGKRILLGYSMGGRIALQCLAAAHHEAWDAAVFISVNPGLRNQADAEARRNSDGQWAARAMSLPWQQFLEEWNKQPILSGTMRNAAADQALMKSRTAIARSFIDWSLGAQPPRWETIANIAKPALWIAGENDEKFRTLAEAAAEKNGQHQLAIAPQTGHRVPWENEAWFIETLHRFVSQLPSHTKIA